jgi:hypothetical protein
MPDYVGYPKYWQDSFVVPYRTVLFFAISYDGRCRTNS